MHCQAWLRTADWVALSGGRSGNTSDRSISKDLRSQNSSTLRLKLMSLEAEGEIDPILLKANQGLLQAELSHLAFLDELIFDNLLAVGKTSRETCDERGQSKVQTCKEKYKLPKKKLKLYEGDLTEWFGYWGQFSKTDADEGLDDSDEFHYLVEAILRGSRAKEVVESFPVMGENYPKAVDSLKSRFGREEMLMEVETKLRVLETLGITSDKYTAMLFPIFESCLTKELLRAWQHNYLKKEVKQEERVSLAPRGFHLNRGDGTSRGTGHVAKNCRMTCLVCGRKDIPILCPKLEENVHPSQELSPRDNEGHTLYSWLGSDVLLQTFLVKIKGSTGEQGVTLGHLHSNYDCSFEVLDQDVICCAVLTARRVIVEGKLQDMGDFSICALWDLDVLGIEDPEMLRTEEKRISAIQERFEESLKWNNGRYEVELPWKEGHDPLPTNFEVAQRCLKPLEQKQNKLKIRQFSKRNAWRYVPGTMNPADRASRGCLADALVRSKWCEGPDWLRCIPAEWPLGIEEVDEDTINLERKVGMVASLASSETDHDWYYCFFSSYLKIIRLMFCELDGDELGNAEVEVVKLIQNESFHGPEDKYLSSLRPYENDCGTLHLKTMILEPKDRPEFRHLAVLPIEHSVVKILIYSLRVQSLREDLRIGLVGSNHEKQQDWPLAMVKELFLGRDGVSRIGRLKTAAGLTTRPIQHINPLEGRKWVKDTTDQGPVKDEDLVQLEGAGLVGVYVREGDFSSMIDIVSSTNGIKSSLLKYSSGYSAGTLHLSVLRPTIRG
ncbi:hypothetical protein PR048_015217 [Dryococelus australis]|uniref:DUF5641 domain-containing protein n=1 Tax=Dryococelus australis TaxID=614101 RepID=A0ABQ9HGK4_9NEOP|nr:hypothetical protein PR048_015217 [Dryococelus australis]